MSDFNDDIDWDNDSEGDDSFEVATPAKPVIPPPPPVGGSQDIEVVDLNAVDNAAAIVSVGGDGESEYVTVIQVDSQGNEIVTKVDMALPPLNENEARDITEKIKGTTNLLFLLIKRAHAGKAYKALGYSSFESYVNEEFNYSRSYAYKLLNQANVIEAIESVAPEGTEVYVGELTARGLKSTLPELLEDIEERTVDASPEDAQRLIEEAIRDHQNRRDEVDDAYEDFDEDFEGGNGGGGMDGDFPSGRMPGDYIEDDDESLDEFLGDEDPTIIVRRLKGLWEIISGLQTFNNLSETADLDELLPLITEDRFEEVTRLIGVNIEWLNRLNHSWNEYRENYTVSDEEDESEESFSDENDDDLRFD